MSIIKENISINKKIDWIAYYQIGGGIIGAVLLVMMTLEQVQTSSLSFLYFLIPILFFSFSVFAGIHLLKRHKSSTLITQINQVIQIPQLSLFGFSYQYFAGLFLGLGISNELGIGFNFSLPNFKFVLTNSNDEFLFMVNLIPIILVILLKKFQRKLEQNNRIIEMLESGKR